jgi:ATP citrate (pro-S)-lyase
MAALGGLPEFTRSRGVEIEKIILSWIPIPSLSLALVLETRWLSFLSSPRPPFLANTNFTTANKEETSFTEQLFTDTVQNAKAKKTPSSDDLPQEAPVRGTVEQEAGEQTKIEYFKKDSSDSLNQKPWYSLFSAGTRAFVYGMQPKAVQGMLDFDHICKRKTPSVAAMIYPFGGSHLQKFYWGTSETLLPVFTSVKEACAKFPDVDVVVNFASFRSVYESTMELLDFPQIRTISIIAEGVPERKTKAINRRAKECDVTIIGPATVGGIKPGCFKIGNTGGMIDNIVSSKLYRSGSVAYVSKSGGMSNELNNIIGRFTDGVYEGVAIGGDRYPGTTFIDHILRFQADPVCKMIVLLGEVGGVEEYKVVEAVKSGKITKPVIAWCIGTCAKMFATEVQFGHAGALANSDLETADAKNQALRAGGILVPDTFEELPSFLASTYKRLVAEGVVNPSPEPETPKIPIDYAWAQELGLVRKPAHFVSTICDDRGQELLYAGMTISEVFKENIGIGGVVSLLWFKRRLPEYATKFIEMVLMLTADHGPAVSGAHNCIVTARAGKDLVSSLTSGLLTIVSFFFCHLILLFCSFERNPFLIPETNSLLSIFFSRVSASEAPSTVPRPSSLLPTTRVLPLSSSLTTCASATS